MVKATSLQTRSLVEVMIGSKHPLKEAFPVRGALAGDEFLLFWRAVPGKGFAATKFLAERPQMHGEDTCI